MENTLVTLTTTFLPATYEVPTDNKYFKLQPGKNRFRIMSSPILGYEWWTDGPDGSRKPNRVPMGQGIPTSQVDNPEDIKHFWAMIVYNYQEKRIQILELTQRSIQKTLYAIAHDPEWSSPVNSYDISINRTGTTKEDTKYEIVPIPPKPTDPAIVDEFTNTYVNLKALFEGKDPFVQELVSEEVNVDEVAAAMDDEKQEDPESKWDSARTKYASPVRRAYVKR